MFSQKITRLIAQLDCSSIARLFWSKPSHLINLCFFSENGTQFKKLKQNQAKRHSISQ